MFLSYWFLFLSLHKWLALQKNNKKTQAFSLCLQNDDEDFNYVIAFFLGTAACLYQVSDSLR